MAGSKRVAFDERNWVRRCKIIHLSTSIKRNPWFSWVDWEIVGFKWDIGAIGVKEGSWRGITMKILLYILCYSYWIYFKIVNSCIYIIMPALHKAWPGNNRFFCGCCITGPARDVAGLIFIYFCLITMVTSFTIFMLRTNWNISPVLPILYYISCFTFNLFILLTACTDPGIIPRRPFLFKNQAKFKLLLNKTT